MSFRSNFCLIALSTVIALSTAGCATGTPQIASKEPKDMAVMVVKGKTTQDDLMNSLGKPLSKKATESGETWRWISADFFWTLAWNVKVLDVEFNNKGVATSFVYRDGDSHDVFVKYAL